ncbi:hypothetical protein KSP24_07775 [Paenibacillus sp. AK121]|uniref:hypothetical protein n=1 Tax=Paenibacillus TaxID=44249 RepID=UPI001C22C12F|nr:hypothetical protein [Paenibacillus sp. AK121]MBU9706827.1 hypothetical protein [Paenibacillus sp. AK121]MEE4567111.1 hypothetical protein [Paenibacillus polymyxa]
MKYSRKNNFYVDTRYADEESTIPAETIEKEIIQWIELILQEYSLLIPLEIN